MEVTANQEGKQRGIQPPHINRRFEGGETDTPAEKTEANEKDSGKLAGEKKLKV